MALKIQPGPLPKDGESLGAAPGTLLQRFVERTDITNFDTEQFRAREGAFYVSGSDPPAVRAPGMLWFRRGDGRLYMWHTQMPSAASSATVNVNGEGSPLSLSWARNDLVAGHWVPLSDRRLIPALAYEENLNHTTPPYGTLRLAAGTVFNAAVMQNDDTVRTPIRGAYEVPYNGSTSAWGGGVNAAYMPRFSAWPGNIYSSKFVMRTTDTTLAGVTLETGLYLELGYYRLGVQPGFPAGPAAVGVSGRENASELSATDDQQALLHAAESGIAYEWGQDDAWTAVITESGPASATTEAAARMVGFWFHSTPNGGWIPS